MAGAETEPSSKGTATVGVLALQGAFAEHRTIVSRVTPRVQTTLVRTTEDLAICDALIIPGGESTSIILLARLANLLGPLREFIKTKPVWGTCAGAILLADGGVEGAKKGGQEVLGGVSVRIGRNGFGSQLESFEAELECGAFPDADQPFTGVFIRAPIILSFTAPDSDRPIEIIARLSTTLLPDNLPYSCCGGATAGDPSSKVDPRTVVALRQGRTLLTTFHPELTRDDRFHEYFVRYCVLGLPFKNVKRNENGA
ncbi:glutamine amidotransferase subunit pdxT [Ceratobasidium sp. AG-I]|nr:glutamine amidotransferase subunit pdxT [Ceratobasidium sp. AG-I]